MVLTGGQRNPVDRLSQLDVTFEVSRNQRLFEPSQSVRAQAFREPDGELHIEAHDGVVHQLGIGPDRVAGLRDMLLDYVDPVDALVVVGGVRDLEALEA